MRRAPAGFAALTCLILSSLWPHTTSAAGALPGQVQQSVALRDETNVRAVTYTTVNGAGKKTIDVGVVRGASKQARLIWRRSLPGPAGRLTAGDGAGVFTVFGAPGHSEGFVAAYRVSGSAVRSAIAGNSSGILTGDRGAEPRSGGFVVQRADTTHAGGVPYRLRYRYRWSAGAYRRERVTTAPDLAASAYPTPNAVIHTASGSTALLKLWVANDQASQDKGLMFIKSMDADQGMAFTWPQDVQESFWMENTYIPLTVAFVSAQGIVLEMQDMAPLTTTYHTPAEPYRYAIEANLGYFARFGVRPGDRIVFHFA